MKWLSTETHRPVKYAGACIIANYWGEMMIGYPRTNDDDSIDWFSSDGKTNYCNICHFIIPDALDVED